MPAYKYEFQAVVTHSHNCIVKMKIKITIFYEVFSVMDIYHIIFFTFATTKQFTALWLIIIIKLREYRNDQKTFELKTEQGTLHYHIRLVILYKFFLRKILYARKHEFYIIFCMVSVQSNTPKKMYTIPFPMG